MVALWIAAGTALAGDSALGVRLLAPLAAALGSILLAGAANDLMADRRSGPAAAAMLNATLVLGVGAVTMTPDTPLLLFWTATLWALARLWRTGDGRWWLVAGLAAGLAADSKYTAFLLAPVALAWVLIVPSLRPWLGRSQPWAAAALAGLLFAPVLAWNARHGWVSFVRQGGRAADWRPARAAQFLCELVAGQAGLATPLLAVLFAAGAVAVLRAAWRREPGPALLACAISVPALVFAQHALGDRVQANWPSVCFPAAALAAAGLGGGWRRLRMPGIVLGGAVTLLVVAQGITALLPLPRMLDPTLIRLGGWRALGAATDAAARSARAAYVASDTYGLAAMLAWTLPPESIVLGADPRWPLFALPPPSAALVAAPGLLLRSARRADPPDTSAWPSLLPLPPLVRSRAGVVAEAYRPYVGTTYGAAPLVVLPRPR